MLYKMRDIRMENIKRTRKVKKKIVVVAVAVLICIAGACYYFLSPNNSKAEVGTVDHLSKELIENRKENKVSVNVIAVNMESVINFENSSSEGEMNIENFPENNYTVNVEIYLKDDDQKPIYKSERFAPGYIIRKDKLDVKLEKGNYECMANVIAYGKDNAEVKRTKIPITINIEN